MVGANNDSFSVRTCPKEIHPQVISELCHVDQRFVELGPSTETPWRLGFQKPELFG
jgi:hypothetical protein